MRKFVYRMYLYTLQKKKKSTVKRESLNLELNYLMEKLLSTNPLLQGTRQPGKMSANNLNT